MKTGSKSYSAKQNGQGVWVDIEEQNGSYTWWHPSTAEHHAFAKEHHFAGWVHLTVAWENAKSNVVH